MCSTPRKNNYTQVRLEASLAAAVREHAMRCGTSLSEFLRAAVTEKLERVVASDATTVFVHRRETIATSGRILGFSPPAHAVPEKT